MLDNNNKNDNNSLSYFNRLICSVSKLLLLIKTCILERVYYVYKNKVKTKFPKDKS